MVNLSCLLAKQPDAQALMALAQLKLSKGSSAFFMASALAAGSAIHKFQHPQPPWQRSHTHTHTYNLLIYIYILYIYVFICICIYIYIQIQTSCTYMPNTYVRTTN